MLAGEGQHFFGAGNRPGGAGDQGRAGLLGELAGRNLVAQQRDGRRRRADPDQAGVDHGLGEGGVFRKKAVAGVNGIRAAGAGGGEDFFDVQIGVGRALAVQRGGLVGQAGVQRVDIGVSVEGDALHAVVGAGADDANGDFAAIGNQDFFHGWISSKGWWARKRTRAPAGSWAARSR